MKNCEEKKGRTRETVWGDEVQAVVAVFVLLRESG